MILTDSITWGPTFASQTATFNYFARAGVHYHRSLVDERFEIYLYFTERSNVEVQNVLFKELLDNGSAKLVILEVMQPASSVTKNFHFLGRFLTMFISTLAFIEIWIHLRSRKVELDSVTVSLFVFYI